MPYADGNPTYWSAHPAIQYPGAALELVFWDGTDILLLSSDAEVTRRFRKHFPDAVPLEDFNRSLRS